MFSIVIGIILLQLVGIAANFPSGHIEWTAAQQIVCAQCVLAAFFSSIGLVDGAEAGEGHQVEEIGHGMVNFHLQGFAVYSVNAQLLGSHFTADNGGGILHGCHFHHEAVLGSVHRINQTSPGKHEVICCDWSAVHPVRILSDMENVFGARFVYLVAFSQSIDGSAVRTGIEQRLNNG